MFRRVIPSVTRGIPRTAVRRSLPRLYATEVPPPNTPITPNPTSKPLTDSTSTPPKLEGNADLLKMLEDAEEVPSPATNNPKEGYKSTADRKRERMANIFLGLFLAGAFGGVLYLGVETEESKATGYSPGAWWQRVKERFVGQVQYYTEPAFEKLLPDPLPEPYQRKYTLVLDLDDLLITSTWTREHGWRTAKRPGLDYFLSYLSQYYEIVVFTNQYAGTALPIIQKLDPYRSSISASLFRESARYDNGKVIKDLSYMNRPMSNIILLDTNPDAVSAQPENAILLKPWKGETGPDSGANELMGYINFLEYVAAAEVVDVRPVLKGYENTHIPTEYARREQELRDKIAASRTASRGGYFGAPKKGASGKVETFMDQQRARAQQAHKEYMQYLKENGEKMLKEEKERENEMLSASKTSLAGYFLDGPPQPPAAAQK
ncbi:CTD small phosphatase-like protein [Taphrina deformans PYCC 5710]|uniref:Mitochondrial import inner membrane translocase subunit TIM50 n=1 Tax=Taphrina deformans (strain PYCC 5710 / ATCC 11124 / CBS 356.35 / IMI 108563 / JCM 9778 / NBRC 8474) TaxID=1097556 RepID=R4XAS4_TAPDE|nr:CTD small phosphatase-like protein [Taphrina deformans PYCC 5710]|eukprot:CCG82918.1 CTD small phosphatase-like protein [Taphrina deformans PYCC 5710]